MSAVFPEMSDAYDLRAEVTEAVGQINDNAPGASMDEWDGKND